MYCGNYQSTNQLTANRPVEGASLFQLLCGLQCIMQTTISIVLNQKGTKTTENGSYQGYLRFNCFFNKECMQPRSQSLINVFKSIVPRLILSPLHIKMNIKDQKMQYVVMAPCRKTHKALFHLMQDHPYMKTKKYMK